MKFCDKCDNMYYIGINPDDTNKLVYYCRNCNYVDARLYNTKCPNKECENKNGVIYMRYDKDKMKYLYMCVDCDATWKTDDRV